MLDVLLDNRLESSAKLAAFQILLFHESDISTKTRSMLLVVM